jgi:hypothetical protein
VSRLVTTPPSIYATDSEASSGYLSLSSASSTYVPQNNAMFAGKNKIINGGFDIWQRGTSIAFGASAYQYMADRWRFVRGSFAAGATFSRQSTNDTTNLPNVQYCARVQRDSGNTSTQYLEMTNALETINSIPFVGKTVTISFYARAGANYSSSANGLVVTVASGTGTDQPYNSFTGITSVIGPETATLTTTWQRFSYTGTVGLTATQLGVLFRYNPVGTAGANDYYEITGVQLEQGSIATSFVPSGGGNIQSELALCQRYYEKSYGHSVFPGSNSTDGYVTGVNSSDGNQITGWRYAVTKRSTPSTRIWNVAGTLGSLSDTGENSININNGSWNCYNPNVNGFRSVVGPGGLTANRTYIYQWEASSEL